MEHAEKENAALKQQLDVCKADLVQALDRAREAEALQLAAPPAHAGDEGQQAQGSGTVEDLASLSKAALLERVQQLQQELAAAQHERRCAGLGAAGTHARLVCASCAYVSGSATHPAGQQTGQQAGQQQ